MRSYSLDAVAELVGGVVENAPQSGISIKGVADIGNSQAHHLSFLAHTSYEPLAYNTSAGALLVAQAFKPKKNIPSALIRVPDVYEALRCFLEVLQKESEQPKTGTETPTYLGKNCQIGSHVYRGAFSYIGNNVEIGNNVQIYPHTYIGHNVRIGSGSILYAGVRVYAGVEIGERCIIQSGAVLGSEGFGYAQTPKGTYKSIPQIGKLVLADDVHIGANTTIDRATFDKTHIETGVRLDNLIQIGHNVQIGKHTAMAAQVGVSGSTRVGPYCTVGGQAGFTGHLQIPARTRVSAQAGVHKSIESDSCTVVGSPAVDPRTFMRSLQTPRRIDKLEDRLEIIEKNQPETK